MWAWITNIIKSPTVQYCTVVHFFHIYKPTCIWTHDDQTTDFVGKHFFFDDNTCAYCNHRQVCQIIYLQYGFRKTDAVRMWEWIVFMLKSFFVLQMCKQRIMWSMVKKILFDKNDCYTVYWFCSLLLTIVQNIVCMQNIENNVLYCIQ